MIAENPLGKNVLATITLPYTNPKDKSKFASIHSNPPGIKTETPSIIYGEYGNGKVVWSASSFERNAQKSHKKVFANLIDHIFSGERILKSDAPEFIQYTLFEDKEQNCALLSAINVQEQPGIVKIKDFKVQMRTAENVEAVKLLPQESDVTFEKKGGAVSFKVKDIDILAMYKIQYAKQ